jgi:hypothetical protein
MGLSLLSAILWRSNLEPSDAITHARIKQSVAICGMSLGHLILSNAFSDSQLNEAVGKAFQSLQSLTSRAITKHNLTPQSQPRNIKQETIGARICQVPASKQQTTAKVTSTRLPKPLNQPQWSSLLGITRRQATVTRVRTKSSIMCLDIFRMTTLCAPTR